MRLIFWTILGLAISLSINVNGETFFYKTEKNPELTLHVFALQDTPQVRVTRKEITATQFGSCTVTWKKQSSQVSSLDALEYVGSFTLSSLDTSCTLDIADLFTSADAEELATQRFTVSMESSSSLRTLSQFETAPKAQIATISSIIYISLESAIGSFELNVNAGGWNLQQVQIALTGELRNLGINLLSAKCKDMGCQTLAVQYEFMTERYAIFLNKSLSPSSVMIQLPAESVKSESLVPSIKVIFNADEVADVTTRKLSEEKVVLEFVLSDRIWLKNDLILLKTLFLHYIFKRWPTDITVNHTTIALSGRKAVLTLNISNFDIFLIHTPALEYHEVLERIASFIYPNNGMKLSTKSSSLNVLQNVELLWNYKESGIIQVPQNSLSTGPRLTQIPESVRDAAFYVELVGPDCEWMDFQHPAQVEVEGGVILLVEDWTFLLDLPHNFRAVHVFAVAHPTLPNVRFFRLSEDWILDIQEIGFTTTYHEHIELKDNVCFHNVVSLIHSPAQLRCELLTAPRHLRADELMWNSIALRPTVLLALDGNCEWRQKLLEDSREKLLKELLPSKIWSDALLASTALTLVDDHTIRISFGLDPSLDLASDERLSVDLSALQQMLRFGSAKVSNAQDLVIQVAEKSELQLIKIFKIVSAVGVSHPLSVSLMQNMILPSWMACQQPSTRFLGYQVQWVMSPLAAVLPVLHQKLPWEINCLLWNFVLLGLILVLYVMGITLVLMCCGHNPIFAGIFSSLMSSLVDFTYFAIIYWVYRSFFMENSLIYLALTVPTLVLYGFILPVSALFWMVMRMPCKVAWVPSSYGWFAPVGVWSPSKEVTETGFLYFEYRDRWYTGKFFVCAFLHFSALLGAAQIPEEMGCHLRLAIWAFLCLFMALWYFIARPSRWLVLDLLRGFVMTLLTILLLLCYITQSGVSLAIFFLASLLTCLLIVPLMWYFSLSDGYWSKRISIENKWALQKRQEYVEMMKLTNAPKEESKNKDSNKDYTQPIQVELVGQSFLNSISHTHEYEFVEAAPRTAVTNLTFLEGIFSTINGDYANKKSTVFDIDNMEYNAAMNFEEEPLSLTTLEALLPEPPQYTENTSGIEMSNSQLNSSNSPAEVSQSTE